MPAIISHRLLGEQALSILGPDVADSPEEKLAFLLACQGPDPFLSRFATTPRRAAATRDVGDAMQDRHMSDAFLVLLDGTRSLPARDRRLGMAFVLGLACHYLFDRTAHPFVIARERAIVEAGEGLEGAERAIHAIIEAELDSWLLMRERRFTVLEYDPLEDLERTERICQVGGALFAQVARSVFGTDLAAVEYGLAVDDYERVLWVANSQNAHVSGLAGAAEHLSYDLTLVKALRHPIVEPDTPCMAANVEHHEWTHPFTGERSRTSFVDLYEEALAAWPTCAVAMTSQDAQAIRSFVAGINYAGEPDKD